MVEVAMSNCANARPTRCIGVRVLGVSKSIKGNPVLDTVSADFALGRVSGIRGHNGSGKTMLLRAIAGLISVDKGSIEVFGEEVGVDGSFPMGVGFMIEPLELWDEFTGLEMLTLLSSLRGKFCVDHLRSTLIRVGLDPNDTRKIKSFSLGMRQRLNLAQALMGNPRLLLLDEPTNALDEDGQETICRILRDERDRGTTIIVVSHDREQLDRIADVQYVMSDGRIREV
ncbi:ABC transporter ATP-binding protein [Collinsella intestinalis]|jgi:ABC-2 type transport system ATP-binding protein|uniref:ABC transporter ATP-binding protein n=1 Tax=Collinsella intestinalis TaxID=147207 RepID=UPI0022DF750E|nr:ABC transporter ATP-binding protein [Collinsella intestinalis]